MFLLFPLMVYSHEKTYNIRCFHEFTNNGGYRLENKITVNSQVVLCHCGNPPCFIFISFGKLDCYCLKHARLALGCTFKEEFDEQKN